MPGCPCSRAGGTGKGRAARGAGGAWGCWKPKLRTRGCAGDVLGTWWLCWGAWEGSQLPAPLSSASSDPEKGSRLLNPPSWGTLGNLCSSFPQLQLCPAWDPGESWGRGGSGRGARGGKPWAGWPRACCGLVGRGWEGEPLSPLTEPLGNSCSIVIQQWGDILEPGQLQKGGMGAPGGSQLPQGSRIEVSEGHRHEFMEPLDARSLQMV